MVHVTSLPKQDKNVQALITTGMQDDNASPSSCEKEVTIQSHETIAICEPPLLGLYVRIRAKDERLNLCEVEVFGTGRNSNNFVYQFY